MENLFRGVLGNENLKVKAENLKAQNVSAMILLSEESRRMMEMMEAYGDNEMYKAMFAQVKPDETLVLNKSNKLVQFLMDAAGKEDKKEDCDMICHQVYDLALMSHRTLTSEEMTAFIDRSNQILEKLAELTDAFYIGGTKCGALFGEALVITNSGLARKFRTYMKQNGAVLAKGWLLGLQFCALLEDDTYEKMTARADAYAMEIKAAFKEKGIPEFVDSYTNQQFVIVTDEQAEKLAKEYTFEQERTLDDGRRVVRFCTSWATTEAEKEQLIGAIRAL